MAAGSEARAQATQPNILVIMGDDIGWSNIGVYHQGIMAGRTPIWTGWLARACASPTTTRKRVAPQGARTSSLANCQSGLVSRRSGRPVLPSGIPAQAPTIATVLRSMGYATGQFGKNHLGDRDEFLPTVHGFDEFWGYLYRSARLRSSMIRTSWPPADKDPSLDLHAVETYPRYQPERAIGLPQHIRWISRLASAQWHSIERSAKSAAFLRTNLSQMNVKATGKQGPTCWRKGPPPSPRIP
jgi:arylsulfatase A-like enzyme